MKKLFGWLIVIAIIVGVIAYANPHLWEDVKDTVMDSNIVRGSEVTKPGYNSIKHITQNKESYLGQEVRVKGKLRERIMSGYNINDNEGYWISLRDNCMEKQRRYVTGSESEIYIAEGTLEKMDEGYGIYYKINCSSPLE